jgi:hypothetical protein
VSATLFLQRFLRCSFASFAKSVESQRAVELVSGGVVVATATPRDARLGVRAGLTSRSSKVVQGLTGFCSGRWQN